MGHTSEQGEWELRGTGLYVPEGPSEAQGQEGGIIMRAPGLVLDRALHNRQERRGAGGGNITYQLINNGITELRERGLLEGGPGNGQPGVCWATLVGRRGKVAH